MYGDDHGGADNDGTGGDADDDGDDDDCEQNNTLSKGSLTAH